MKNEKIWIIVVILTVFLGYILCMYIGITAANQKHQGIQDSLLTEIQTLRGQVALLSEPVINEEHEFKTFALENHDPKFTDIVNIVWEKSKEHNVSPYKILSIIQVESGFNSKAVSKAGAYGLMQVQFKTWNAHFKIEFPEKLFDSCYNVDLGIQIYKHYKEKTNGDVERALHHYNAGYKKFKNDYPAKVMNSRFFK